MKLTEYEHFNKITVQELKANGHNFEHCRFTGCDFSYQDLSGIRFADCAFTGCNLSLAQVSDTAWQNVSFADCKLTGVHFNKSSNFLFELHFTSCILDNAIFYQKKNKKSRFVDCSLMETDFTEADLTSAVFERCNMERTYFNRTILKGADLSTSYNYIINPEENSLAKAKFSIQGLPGLLSRHQIIVKY